MNEKEFNKKERQKLIIAGIFCLIAIISVIGYTYSYFTVSATDSGTITGTVASASLSLTVEKLAPDNTDKDLVPQLDSAIASAVVGTQGNCIDDNLNTVCQVYQVTVTNTSSMAINVDGTLSLNAGSNPNLKWALIDSYTDGMSTKPTVTSSINSHTTKTITANEEYSANEEKIYYIVVWISETGYVQSDTGSFTGVVTFKIAEDSSAAATTLYSLGIAPNTDTPSFANTSCSSGCGENTVGVYAAEDDLGTSYYFRGDVENNYVLFDNKYFRIIRINGDGSIRMIYDGTSAHDNGESSTDRYITTSVFNSSYSDNAYVGYMYGTAGASTYVATHANTTDSTIKTYLEDTWYPTLSDDAKSKIVDAIYCNDREVSTANSSYTGDGSGTNKTWYKAAERLVTNKAPVLTCTQENDRFTYDSSNFEIATNGKLEAPVGLITADEVAMAGGVRSTSNSKYYLYTGNWYWTSSPYDFYGSSANEFFVYASGNFYGDYVGNPFGVRSVVSLSSEAITGGNGTKTSPFTTT